ncbi:MAG: DoxX family membrane protein [Candidatus Hodarchaeales archaeon]
MHEQKISGGYLVLLRLTLGFSFLTTWFTNLFKGAFTGTGFVDTISYFIDHSDHIVTPFDTIIRNVAFPNAALFGFGWMIMELIISVSLILGAFTRLGSLFGAGSTIILGLGALGVDWPWTYALLFIGFVTCGLVGAGRWYGVDFWLKDRIPTSFAKFIM